MNSDIFDQKKDFFVVVYFNYVLCSGKNFYQNIYILLFFTTQTQQSQLEVGTIWLLFGADGPRYNSDLIYD